MKLEPGKFYRTRGGKKYQCYRTDAGGSEPVHGAYEHTDGDWAIVTHSKDGSFVNGRISNFDIISEWTDKPDCSTLWPLLPPWIKWVAMDSDKRWWGYSLEPALPKISDSWQGNNTECFCTRIHPDYAPTFTDDWKDSLCERPAE